MSPEKGEGMKEGQSTGLRGAVAELRRIAAFLRSEADGADATADRWEAFIADAGRGDDAAESRQ